MQGARKPRCRAHDPTRLPGIADCCSTLSLYLQLARNNRTVPGSLTVPQCTKKLTLGILQVPPRKTKKNTGRPHPSSSSTWSVRAWHRMRSVTVLKETLAAVDQRTSMAGTSLPQHQKGVDSRGTLKWTVRPGPEILYAPGGSSTKRHLGRRNTAPTGLRIACNACSWYLCTGLCGNLAGEGAGTPAPGQLSVGSGVGVGVCWQPLSQQPCASRASTRGFGSSQWYRPTHMYIFSLTRCMGRRGRGLGCTRGPWLPSNVKRQHRTVLDSEPRKGAGPCCDPATAVVTPLPH